MKIFILGVILTLQFIAGSSNSNVQEVFNWKKFELEHVSLLENTFVGPYKYRIPENEHIVSMGYHPASGLMIVAFVRRRPGVATNLGAFCASEYNFGSSPKIWRFPNYHVNDLRPTDFTFINDAEGKKQLNPLNTWENSYYNHIQRIQPYHSDFYKDVAGFGSGFPVEIQRIVSVFHLTIDEKCNRVFMVDNGQMGYHPNFNETYDVQKPALVVIGLPTNGCHIRNFPILRRVELPDFIIAKGGNGYMHVTLDYQPSGSCDDLYLYITNSFHSHLTIFNYATNDFWSFEHENFKPVHVESHLVFDKTLNYQLLMGITSVALDLPDVNGDKIAYYTPFAGVGQYVVSTSVLKDKSKALSFNYENNFKIMGYRGCKHQSLKTAIDNKHGVIFYGEAQSNQIRCWNIRKPLNPDNIGVVFESEDLGYAADLFVDSLGYLWFLSTKVPIVVATVDPLDLDTVNNRIYRVSVADAIRGTVCA